MTHQNLILTEKAIKNHSKRLQKELKILNQDLSLGETQNLFSKTLGFNNFHELKKVLDNNNDISDTLNELDILFKNETQFICNLTLNDECFKKHNINFRLESEQDNIRKIIKYLKFYEQQIHTLDSININFAKLLSTFPRYSIDGDKWYGLTINSEQLTLKRLEAIQIIIDFVEQHNYNLNYNVKNKEGLNLLSILLIFGNTFETYNDKILKNKIINLINELLEKTNFNLIEFEDFNCLILLIFNSFLTTNHQIIINKFIDKVLIDNIYYSKQILSNLVSLKFKTSPNIKLIKKLIQTTNNYDKDNYINNLIVGIIDLVKPQNRSLLQEKEVLNFLIMNNYNYDLNIIRAKILKVFDTIDLNNFEITDNLKYITSLFPKLIDSDFKNNLLNTIIVESKFTIYLKNNLGE